MYSDNISSSPFRVTLARLAAAQAMRHRTSRSDSLPEPGIVFEMGRTSEMARQAENSLNTSW